MSRFVRIDTHVGLSDVFASTARSATVTPVTVTGRNVSGLHSEFQIPQWLGPSTGDLYVGIHELASTSAESINTPASLRATGEFAGATCRVVHCTWRDLARVSGFSGFGRSTAGTLRENLERLALVRQNLYERRVEIGGCQWLSWDVVGRHPMIVLNPRSSWLLGMSRAELKRNPVTFLSLDERDLLPDGAARQLHLWLSTWARPRADLWRPIYETTLATHIWKDVPGGTTTGRRYTRLQSILRSLDGLGGRWAVKMADGKVLIRCEPRRSAPAPATDSGSAATSSENAGGDVGKESTSSCAPSSSAPALHRDAAPAIQEFRPGDVVRTETPSQDGRGNRSPHYHVILGPVESDQRRGCNGGYIAVYTTSLKSGMSGGPTEFTESECAACRFRKRCRYDPYAIVHYPAPHLHVVHKTGGRLPKASLAKLKARIDKVGGWRYVREYSPTPLFAYA
jgi:hypothetical protein